MERQTLRRCTACMCSRLMLGPLLVAVCTALLVALALFNAERFEFLSRFGVLSTKCSCDSDASTVTHTLGPQPSTFLLDLDDDLTNTSLLHQVGRYQGNVFVLIKQKDDEKPLAYGISMFHQLHCIEMLRDALQGKPHAHGHHSSQKRQIDPEEHVAHCLDYISQVRLILRLISQRRTEQQLNVERVIREFCARPMILSSHRLVSRARQASTFRS